MACTSSLLNKKKLILRFLWVKLQLKEIISARIRSPAAIDHIFENLPRSLDDFYDKLFVKINGQNGYDSNTAHKVLSWVMYAPFPITFGQLANAFTVDCENRLLDEAKRLQNLDELLHACGNLVLAVEPPRRLPCPLQNRCGDLIRGEPTQDRTQLISVLMSPRSPFRHMPFDTVDSVDTVDFRSILRFVHMSVPQYIQRRSKCSINLVSSDIPLCLSQTSAALEIALTSVTYLCLCLPSLLLECRRHKNDGSEAASRRIEGIILCVLSANARSFPIQTGRQIYSGPIPTDSGLGIEQDTKLLPI